jgi:hypothetical protein
VGHERTFRTRLALRARLINDISPLGDPPRVLGRGLVRAHVSHYHSILPAAPAAIFMDVAWPDALPAGLTKGSIP